MRLWLQCSLRSLLWGNEGKSNQSANWGRGCYQLIIICVISSWDPPIKPVVIINCNHWVCAEIIICVISSWDPPIKPVAIIKCNHCVRAEIVVFNASLDVTTRVQWNPPNIVGWTYIKGLLVARRCPPSFLTICIVWPFYLTKYSMAPRQVDPK